ncbi:hypothetical protein C0991_008672, partial [Blastosporella zonata]
MALYGWPISQCQERSTPLDAQLQSGIRVLDIRLAIINSRLIAYHGIYPQRTSFQEILSIIHKFLTSPSTCRETIVMSIKQEDFEKHSYLEFSLLVHKEMFNGPGGRDMWYLQNRIPTLGEVRGKVVMFSRFGGNGEGWEGCLEGLGIHPLVWPDSEKSGFSWQCKDTLVSRTLLSRNPREARPRDSDPTTPERRTHAYTVDGFPLRRIHPIVPAPDNRQRIWMATGAISDEKHTADGPRVRGWVMLDYYDHPDNALTPLLVECNYRGRQKGEEGW